MPRGLRWLTPYLFLVPGGLWLLAFFVVPMLVMASISLQEGTLGTGFRLTFNFGVYGEMIAEYLPQFGRSIIYALVVTGATLLIGYPIAYTIAFRGGRAKNILLLLVILPFFTAFIIRTLSWKLILADDGFIVNFLQFLQILGDDGRLLATPVAVVAGLTYNFLPFMVLPLYASIDKIDERLIEAASDLYSNPVVGFFKVTWPLSLPGVISGTLLTFIPASGDYINAQLLGSPNERMVGNVIQDLFTDANDYPAAGALSMIMMILIVLMVLFYVRRAGTEELL